MVLSMLPGTSASPRIDPGGERPMPTGEQVLAG